MNVAVPTPGGAAVTLPRFGIMTVGAALGLVAYAHYLTNIVPDNWEEWNIGPVKGTTLFMGASALLGGALMSMAFSRFSK